MAFRRLGQGSYILGESEVKQLRLSAAARAELRDDFRKLPSGKNAVRQSWDVYLKGKAPIHPITFDPETAEKKRDTFFITPMHPLAKQAAAYFASNEQAYIRLQYATEDLPSGNYHFSVYAWSYVGINPHFKLVVVCDDDVIAAELSDILQESQSGAAAVKMQPSDWDALEKKQVKLWMDEKANEIKEKGSLAENNPTLAKEWHPVKNGNLTPWDITEKRFKKVWWLCSRCGYEWEASPLNRGKGVGCPCCSGRVPKTGVNDLRTLYPEIVREWDYSKNTGLQPECFLPRSGKKVWWKCKVCGHEWEAVIRSRTKGSGCPNYRKHNKAERPNF